MFLSVLVDWMIPDIPKDISEQIKKEKSVLVDFFLTEERKKLKLIESFITCDKHKHKSVTKDQRIRAASFSQFNQSQKGSIVSFSSQHTEVWLHKEDNLCNNFLLCDVILKKAREAEIVKEEMEKKEVHLS